MGSSVETVDVVICGCGPTGAMLSAQLGKLGVNNLVLEKTKDITTDPRGIALDEDGIRALQNIGLYDSIYKDIRQCMEDFKFIGGEHTDLRKKPFLVYDYSTTEGGTGHVEFICHRQPILEKRLRDVIFENEFSHIRMQATVVSAREDNDWVYITWVDEAGTENLVRARYLVGTDGKTGFTRKQYFEPKGVEMGHATRCSFPRSLA